MLLYYLNSNVSSNFLQNVKMFTHTVSVSIFCCFKTLLARIHTHSAPHDIDLSDTLVLHQTAKHIFGFLSSTRIP